MKEPKISITVEQANGDSFAKRIYSACRYVAKTDGYATPEEKAKAVREIITRALENAVIAVWEINEQGLKSYKAGN